MPDERVDEFEMAKYVMRKRLRLTVKLNTNNENETEQPCLKRIVNSIYKWDEDFHFTTMVTCTYTVAVVLLHYLACTFVFLYLSRTTGHLTFFKSYIESFANDGK